jgi:hypothetical protein
MNAIRTDKLSKRYGATLALDALETRAFEEFRSRPRTCALGIVSARRQSEERHACSQETSASHQGRH